MLRTLAPVDKLSVNNLVFLSLFEPALTFLISFLVGGNSDTADSLSILDMYSDNAADGGSASSGKSLAGDAGNIL